MPCDRFTIAFGTPENVEIDVFVIDCNVELVRVITMFEPTYCTLYELPSTVSPFDHRLDWVWIGLVWRIQNEVQRVPNWLLFN